jgi:hypothetical protein
MAPQEILAAGAAPRRRLATPLGLGLEDAVTYQLDDYVVRGIISYFAGAREWRTYQLHDGKQERWLEVRGNGAEVGWYELQQSPPGEGAQISSEGGAPAEAGSATVGVESAAGRRDGVFVEYQRFRRPDGSLLVVERWPDGTRVLSGRAISRDDLDLWTKPAATE